MTLVYQPRKHIFIRCDDNSLMRICNFGDCIVIIGFSYLVATCRQLNSFFEVDVGPRIQKTKHILHFIKCNAYLCTAWNN